MPPFSDSTLSLLSQGYAWLPNRMRTSTDGTVRTRLLGRPTIALRGPEAVEFFYDERHVLRAAALPDPVLDTLFGQGAVHTLDGDAHRARKAMFLALLKDEAGVAALGDRVGQLWREAAAGRKQDRMLLFDETSHVLARAVCDWVGLPLAAPESAVMARDCTAMVDGFATPGPRHLRARRARAHQEKALAAVITGIRAKPGPDSELSALEAVARQRDADGNLLDVHIAAVELLNIIRPTVAIAWFATFAAHALHRWPQHREFLRADPDRAYARAFAHEVRRFYPFAPFVGGLAADDLTWRGQDIAKNSLILLDLYGQNHDSAVWEHPYRFDPHRFSDAGRLPDNLVPQGGGDPARGHRCPGEDITIATLAILATELAHLDYEVPDQDLTIPLSRMPTAPRSGFVLTCP
ncbi:cytochrome P450 [Streptomyces sp. 3211]|uniref:cytochrome P450 n=2 Tax=unclassified Streptomyces TaxID=2593676 RepID=UPI0009A4B3D0|nr:cytochrome P450 [Streptomyces sp. 3211]